MGEVNPFRGLGRSSENFREFGDVFLDDVLRRSDVGGGECSSEALAQASVLTVAGVHDARVGGPTAAGDFGQLSAWHSVSVAVYVFPCRSCGE